MIDPLIERARDTTIVSRRRALVALAAGAFAPALARAQQHAGPYVPTPWNIVDEMLRLAAVRADDVVLDLGSGDGRLVIAAAERFGARGHGVDIDGELVKLATENARRAGVADRVTFERRDLFETNLGGATVLTLYLLPHIVTQLAPRILAEMPAGARVVSHDYPLSPWSPDRHLKFDLPEKVEISGTARTVLYLYTVPARIRGAWRLELPPGLTTQPAHLVFDQDVAGTNGVVIVGNRRLSLQRVWIAGENIRFTIPGLGPGPASLTLEGVARGDIIEGTAPAGPVPWRARRIR